MSLTNAQQSAVSARGNVLVVAGAGTGKTSTLVERCLALLLDEKPPLSLDEVLIVTFTEAAAAEIRQRIRQRLDMELTARRTAGDTARVRHLREQLALFETAHIGTLHSFCLQLVRQHFYELELDPQLTVLPNEEAHLLAGETLDGILQRHYAGRTPNAARVQELIESQSRGSDKSIRSLILRLHHYMQTRPDARGWLATQEQAFAKTDATQWQAWLKSGIGEWTLASTARLAQIDAENGIAAECARILPELQTALSGSPMEWKAAAATVLAKLAAVKENCPYGKKTLWVKPLESFFVDVDFVLALLELENGKDPLAEDWLWVREQMQTLLELTREFTQTYTEAKRELGAVDFHDLEQYALQLLWNRETGEVSDIGREWRNRLRFVFVDEYQDINAAQDKIIEGLSRDAANGNRFLVGDVKQSIYRFRLAEPRIFQNYAEDWRANAQVIALRDNFRSEPGILSFVNSLFSLVMHRKTGGVEYDAEAALSFGNAHPASPSPSATAPPVELHLLLKPPRSAQESEAGGAQGGSLDDLEDSAKEARLVGLRLIELQRAGRFVWDGTINRQRPMEWRDVAVLLRSPANKAESYAKEFSRLRIPLEVSRGGFYENLEICDLLNLLRLLDNPLQDLPLVAVLRSPLVAMDVNDLARIRLAASGPFWTALVRFAETEDTSEKGSHRDEQATVKKTRAFLGRFTKWRPLARQGSLSQCLERVLAETHYAEWILTQDRGQQRHSNIRRLLALARQFDEFQQQGLFRFLRFIDAQMEADTEPEVAAVAEENAVRLLSIHQSKGLEFPIVVVADIGKTFNDMDLRSDLILDEEYGLCPQIKPPQSNTRYPSLPYWLARHRQRRELLGEELRLLYVAATRARDLLVLTGAISEKRFERDWTSPPDSTEPDVDTGRSYAEWIAEWFRRNVPYDAGMSAGRHALLDWKVYHDADLALPEAAAVAGADALEEDLLTSPDWESVQKRVAWQYAFPAATEQPAKTSVTALRQQLAEQRDDAALPLFDAEAVPDDPTTQTEDPIVPVENPAIPHGADTGRANHKFLELLSLDQTDTAVQLRAEAARLEAENLLTTKEGEVLDIEGIAAFWQSDLGRAVRQHKASVRREIAFTARFPAGEIATLLGKDSAAALAEEFVVIQGVADLVVFRENEIWVVDFKTDALDQSDLVQKVESYSPQIRLYARALAEIFKKPVTQRWLYFLATRMAAPVADS